MIKAVLVDDERLARVDLKRLLNQVGGAEVIAEFSNAEDFLAEVDTLLPDLIFLDINMPGMLGIDAAAQLKPGIQFIFCTAYAEYAAQAFDLKSVDYLVKPVRRERLQQALERCNFADKKPEFLPDRHHFLLTFNDMQRIVRLDQIERFEVVGNELAVYCTFGRSYLRLTMKQLEDSIDPSQYIKASRSELLRLDKVAHFEKDESGAMVAIMQSNIQIKISRRQAQKIKAK